EHRHIAALVEPTDLDRTDALLDTHQLTNRNAVDRERVERLERATRLVRKPHDDRDPPVEVDELRGFRPAHVRLDLACDALRFQAPGRCPLAVDLDPE